MERLHVSIPFFLWFPTCTSKFGLPDVYSKPSLNAQTALMKVWHFVKGGSVSSIHPPLADLTFLLQDVALTATPFRKGREGDTAEIKIQFVREKESMKTKENSLSLMFSSNPLCLLL